MLIDKELLDFLTALARTSLHQHYDLRNSENDDSQRMLNAIEPGTVIPIHKHSLTSEDVIVLRGIAEEVFFDDEGKETGRYQLVPGGETLAILMHTSRVTLWDSTISLKPVPQTCRAFAQVSSNSVYGGKIIRQ